MQKHPPVPCVVCGTPLKRPGRNKFCSHRCEAETRKFNRGIRNCKRCNQIFQVLHRNPDQEFCSRQCRAENDRKGCIGKDGYVYICYNKKQYLQHRFVMEQHLGRPLLTSEVIHHIDGNKQNNSLDNLMLISSHAEHAYLHKPRYLSETEGECTKCHVIKPLSDFNRRSKTSNKRTSECKECRHKKYVESRKKAGLPTAG